MAKLTLDSVTSGYASNTLLNANFDAIEAALENTVSRDGTTPNNLTADLDMNSQRLINLATPLSETDAVTKAYVDTKVSVATGIGVTELSNLRIWDFSTDVSMADPGAGTFRLNNSTPNLATSIALSATSGDAGNPDLSDWIASWDASSNGVKGQVILTDTSDPNNVIIFYITGTVTDNSTWLQMTLMNVEQSGSMADGATYHVNFTRAGDVGSATVSDGDKGDITVSGGGLAWNIDAGAVGTPELATNAVTTAKITNSNVTSAKLATNVQDAILNKSATIFVPKVIDGDITLGLKERVGFTISGVTTKAASGTCTATIKINTTALGGTANSVTSSESTQAHASANVLAAGDDLICTISANSACLGMALTVTYTEAF